MENQHPLVKLGFILGGSFLIAVVLGAVTIFQLRSLNDTVSVTGSAKMEVVSDQAKWTTQISRTVRESSLKAGYAQLASDLVDANAFFKAQGITTDELTTTPVAMNEVYQQNETAEKQYTLVQTFTVQSNDVAKLTTASNHVAELINKGTIFSTIALEYYYSKLADTRIQLLSQAIADAKARAGELAKNSGRGVGTLKSASSGVVQVQSLNSTDVSDYGSYDTSQIQKQITVTVKASFALK
ncbi:MAG: SIMPL domain-containing protein [Candidatus Paceibacterota bacterium]